MVHFCTLLLFYRLYISLSQFHNINKYLHLKKTGSRPLPACLPRQSTGIIIIILVILNIQKKKKPPPLISPPTHPHRSASLCVIFPTRLMSCLSPHICTYIYIHKMLHYYYYYYFLFVFYNLLVPGKSLELEINHNP